MQKILGKICKFGFWLWLFKQFTHAVGILGDADFVIQRVKDPGWIRTMMEYLINPSPIYIQIPAFVFGGYLLFYWLHIRKKTTQIVQEVKSKETLVNRDAEVEVTEIELPEERGFLDFMADFEDTSQNIRDCIIRMSNITSSLDRKIRTRTAEFEKYKKMLGSPGGAKRLKDIAQKAASDILQYTKDIEDELSKLHHSWGSLEQNTISFVNTVNMDNSEIKKGMETLRLSLYKFRDRIKGAVGSQQMFRQALETCKGISQELNKAISRATKTTDNVILECGKGESCLEKIIDSVNERLR